MKVAAGWTSSFAVDAEDRVWAWGSVWGKGGPLGVGTEKSDQRRLPVRVSAETGMTDVVTISAGANHSLAVDKSGRVWAWGAGSYGELGTGGVEDGALPTLLSAPTRVLSVSGGSHHSLALDDKGRVWAWGYNGFGQLGTGDMNERLVPTLIDDLSDVVAVSAGQTHSVALDSEGQVWAWGNNEFGTLCTGDTQYRVRPTLVLGVGDVVAIAAGLMHTLAVDRSGQVWAWGNNWGDRLGIGCEYGVVIPPSAQTTARLRGEQKRFAWPKVVLTPVVVPGAANVVEVAVDGELPCIDSSGDLHSLAIDRDGCLWSWGSNDEAQLGTGDRKATTLPTRVGEIRDVVSVATSKDHSLAMDSQGQVWAWGGDGFLMPQGYLLGLGEKKGRRVPTKVALST